MGDHWHGGLYVNRADPAVWVKKRGGGVLWTLNFGNPRTWVLLAVTLLGAWLADSMAASHARLIRGLILTAIVVGWIALRWVVEGREPRGLR